MNSEFLKKLLKKGSCFRELSEHDLTLLAQTGELKRLNAGVVIYRKGDASEGRFCMIVTGKVGIVTETDQIIKNIGPGEVLGEIAITSPQNVRTATVKTLEPTNIMEWDINKLKANMPALMRKLKEQAWKNLADYYERTVKQPKVQPADEGMTKVDITITVTFHKLPTARPVNLKDRPGTFQRLEFVGDQNLKVAAIVTTETWNQFTQAVQGLTSWVGSVSGKLTSIIQGKTLLILDAAELQYKEMVWV